MSEGVANGLLAGSRLLIGGLVAVIVVLGFALVVSLIVRGAVPAAGPARGAPVDALAGSDDRCVRCHRRATPGIVSRHGRSTMAMGLLIVASLVGAWLPVRADLAAGGGTIVVERLLHAVPPLAPLLFTNLGVPGLLVLLPDRQAATAAFGARRG